MVLSKASGKRAAGIQIRFQTAPQAAFNKQYDLLADDIEGRASQGYTTYILSENHAQFERLENVLAATHRKARFEPLKATLHEGFTDRKLRVSLYTDHQIFDRYHRYQLRGGIDNRESLTIAELNQLQVGDYVVAFAGQEVHATEEILAIRRTLYVGDQVTIRVWRDGQYLDLLMEMMAAAE